MIPNTVRINRGGYVIKDLTKMCIDKNVTDLVILHEHRGVVNNYILIEKFNLIILNKFIFFKKKL